VLEVNGLSEIGVGISIERKSVFAPIEAVRLSWWRKVGEEYRSAIAERERSSKVGRMARLRGKADRVEVA
jgi:hypothetical protein